MTWYTVKGWDRSTDDTVILFEGDSMDLVTRWAKRYASTEDAGGWDKIYVSHLYQVDVDWEGEPVYSEHISYVWWREPMDYPDNAMEEF